MVFFILIFLLSTIFCFRKLFSNYYFSPSGFLIATWLIFLVLRFLLAGDYFFSDYSAVLIFIFTFSFFLGELFMGVYISISKNSIISRSIERIDFLADAQVFNDIKIIKRLEKILLIMGILSLVGSMLYVYFFVDYFGSVMNVLTAGWALRGAMEEISIPLVVRAILMLGYSSIILTLVYFILYNKFKWYFLFSYLAILIMGITQAGRAGFMLVFFQIFIASYWRNIYKSILNDEKTKGLYKSPEFKLFKSSSSLVLSVGVIFVGGDMLRSQNFSLNSEVLGQGFSSFKSYLFGGIAGFSSYLDGYSISELGWGRFSFSSLYGLLGIHKNITGIYTDYLRISIVDASLVTNIFTAFRQLIDDFGIFGTIIFMFISGLFSFVIFRKAIKGDISSIAFLIVFYSFIFHTPLLAITVHNAVLVSAILPYLIIVFLKNSVNKK